MTNPAENSPAVAIACGGTGGHLFPGIAVAGQLVQRGCTVTLLISPKEVDQQAVLSARGVKVVTLPAVAFQKGSRLAFLPAGLKSWVAARKHFRSQRPRAVLAMGGFTSAPPILAARSLGAATFLHESNTIPGRANRWLARFVDQAFVGFPSAASRLAAREVTVTGTPVRPEFENRDAAQCRAALGFDPNRPLVLVTGGSQGASGINDLIMAALPGLARRVPDWQWLHLTGPVGVDKIKSSYAALGLKASVHPFFAQMDLALGAATACVSRAGASSLAEIAAARVPSLLIPFPFAADDHQLHNARAFESSGAARVLGQSVANADTLATILLELVENIEVRQRMQTALAQWHTPRAAEAIAEIMVRAAAATVERMAARQVRSAPVCDCDHHRHSTRIAPS